MKNYWVSFWVSDLTALEYHGPWWVTGSRDGAAGVEGSICAAVMATDEADAERVLRAAFDPGHAPTEWRFTHERGSDWNPLAMGSRFPSATWMQWPWPVVSP